MIGHILRRRLEECAAARQLSPAGQTITEIAFAGGFNSTAHFSRAFRQQYGSTPAEYRDSRHE